MSREKATSTTFTNTVATSPASACLSAAFHAPPPPQWQAFAFSSVSATVAAPFTNPFAVAKTQLQVQKNGSTKRFRGMLDFFRHAAAASNGFAMLQRGVVPVMMREGSMNLFRIGLYCPIVAQLHDETDGPVPIYKRMLAGALSGAIGSAVCNPFEIVRIKMQAQLTASESMGRRILQEEGAKGFFKAAGVSVVLGMVCTSVNMTTYTLFHEAALERFGMEDGPAVDIPCALASGFLAAIAMNPIDVTRTRLMTQPSPPIYRNAFHAVAEIMKNEGPTAFFKGFVPSFLRIGPHFVLTFLLLEQMRRFAHTCNAANARKAYLTSVFHTIDTDKSGEIDRDELLSALQSANPLGDRDETDRIANAIFIEADADGSGEIDLDEFLNAPHTSELEHLLRGQQLRAIFKSFDTNGDGTVDESELLEALRGGRKAPSSQAPTAVHDAFEEQLRKDVHKIMNEVDKDGSKAIDFAEFSLAFDRMEALQERRSMEDLVRGAGVALGA